jgi:putative oxidoreductase
MDLALLVLRIVVGLLFVGHGAQKLFGAFGGSGIEGTAGFFEKTGLAPGRAHATAAGVAELGGGLLAAGLLTTIAAAALIAVMTAAVIAVHGRKGIWNSDGGFEYNAVLVAVAFALATIGAGSWSLDSALGVDMSGVGWGLAALGAGLIGGGGAVLAGRIEERQRPHDHHHTPPHPA